MAINSKKSVQFSEQFLKAVDDYVHFTGRAYPPNTIHKLVADRYKLTRQERSMLFRGIFNVKESDKRSKKRVQKEAVSGKILTVDTLNQLLAIVSYLNGKMVYLASDGFVRDVAEYHGNIPHNIHLERAIEKVMQSLLKLNPLHTDFIIDRQVPEHKSIAAMIRFDAFEERFPFQVIITDKTDQRLKTVTKGIIATSDTQIIDQTKKSVFDLAHYVLSDHFQPKFPDLFALLQKKR
ncbi:MAG: DUF434 domain-containing protein [Bacteroidetes bacterium]|nr:DUF434 domain-containing protein [Bacteroidota bacterium]